MVKTIQKLKNLKPKENSVLLCLSLLDAVLSCLTRDFVRDISSATPSKALSNISLSAKYQYCAVSPRESEATLLR